MKRIKINKIEKGNKTSLLTREKLHSISLGNGLTCYFTNIKNADSFMAETNRMLNTSAQLLNKLYIETWTAQRVLYLTHHWIFIRNWNCHYIPLIEKDFNLLLQRSHWQNGNQFTFKYFYSIIEYLHDWINETVKLLKDNHKTYDIEAFMVCKEQTNYLKAKLDTWGKEHFDNRPNCFYDKRPRLS